MHPNDLLGEGLDEASRSPPAVAASACELAGVLRGANVDAAARGIGQLAETSATWCSCRRCCHARDIALDTLQTREGQAMPLQRPSTRS